MKRRMLCAGIGCAAIASTLLFTLLPDPSTPAPMPLDADTAWTDLCDLLSDGDRTLLSELILARHQPGAYFARFEDALWERGIEDARGVDPWLALVDGLQSRGRLREFDWKLEADDLAFQLQRLVPCKDRNIALDRLRTSEATGDALLSIAAAGLAEHGLGLLLLEIDGDCYPLTVCPSHVAPDVVRLATRIGKSASLLR